VGPGRSGGLLPRGKAKGGIGKKEARGKGDQESKKSKIKMEGGQPGKRGFVGTLADLKSETGRQKKVKGRKGVTIGGAYRPPKKISQRFSREAKRRWETRFGRASKSLKGPGVRQGGNWGSTLEKKTKT